MKDRNRKAFIKGISDYASYLKLTVFKTDLEEVINDATTTDLSYEELVYILLQK